MINVLLLDDDPRILRDVSELLNAFNINVLSCSTVDEATNVLEKNKIDFSIVDLFLLGARGDYLSNKFISENLIPKSIRFGRLTSAVSLVPEDLEGEWVVDKRLFYHNEQVLIDKLIESEILK